MNEEELRRRLDAELGRVPVRPYAEYRGRSRERRSVAPFGAAALVTVLLVGAVGAGQLLRSAREAPASSPSPSIGASPSPALAQDGYGVAVVDLRGLTVYRESDGAAVARHPARFPAISPDGARFAYADEGRVYLAPVGRPEAASLLLDVGPEVVSRVVWAIDGTGLLIGVRSAEALPGPGATPRYSGLRTVEIHRTMLSSSGIATYGVRVTERLRLEERSLEPLLWDRSRDLVAGLEHFGQKGVGSYLLSMADGEQRRHEFEGAADADVTIIPPRASTDGRLILGGRREGAESELRHWQYWPADRPEEARELAWAGGVDLVQWLPRTHDLLVLSNGMLEIATLEGERHSVAPVPLGQLVPRFDGSGVYVGPLGEETTLLIELGSGRSSVMPIRRIDAPSVTLRSVSLRSPVVLPSASPTPDSSPAAVPPLALVVEQWVITDHIPGGGVGTAGDIERFWVVPLDPSRATAHHDVVGRTWFGGVAASHDGRVAYWDAGGETQSGGRQPPHDLVVFDPRTGESRVVLSVAQGSPMRPAWSADGQRLVFTIRSDATAQLPPVPPATTTLNVVDLESGEQRELARYADEHPLEPAYADADVVAGFRGFHDGEYEALDLRSGAALRSAPVSELFQGVVTSADGAVAGIVRPFEAEPTLLRVWRGADFATELARVEQDVPFEVLFWPGRTELVYARGEALWAMDYLNGERRMIRSGAGTPVAFTPDGRFLALRIESRAYLVLEREGDGLRPVGEVRADRLPRVERVIGLVTMP